MTFLISLLLMATTTMDCCQHWRVSQSAGAALLMVCFAITRTAVGRCGQHRTAACAVRQ